MENIEIDQEVNQEVELNKFLAQNSISLEDYNHILTKITIEELTDYLGYKKLYNVKVEDYSKWKKSFNRIQTKPSFLDLDYFIRCKKDRSYQSNIKMTNDLVALIKAEETEEDYIEDYYSDNPTFALITQTNDLTKFRKVVTKFLEEGSIPKLSDSFKMSSFTDMLNAMKKDIDKTERIKDMSIESVTALQTSKDLFNLYYFSDKSVAQTIESYKPCIAVKSYGLVVNTFKDLANRSKEINK